MLPQNVNKGTGKSYVISKLNIDRFGKGEGRAMLSPTLIFASPYYRGTTISFTEILADFLFYALQHKLPIIRL